MRRIITLGILSMLFCGGVGWIIWATAFRKEPRADLTAATTNARNVGIILFDFDQGLFCFPSPATAANPALFATTPPSATANDLLGQLIRAEYTQSEEIFHTQNTFLPPKKPDNIILPESRILEPGECSFSYICGLSSKDDPHTPLLLAPMIPGTTTFDRKALKGKAVILCVDQSIRQFPINSSGHVLVDGKDLFDPAQPFWHGKKPDLRHPAR